jgi:hypothetical protein
MKGLRITADIEKFSRNVELRFMDEVTRSIASPIEMKPVEEGAYMPPAAVIPATAAQELMDELWQCGFRPSEGTGSAGSLAATERHLKDLQRVAFGLLEKEGVKV